MSDIGADYDAAVILVEAAEDRLLEKDKEHALVAYLMIEDDVARERAWQEQLRRFSKNPEEKGNVKGSMAVTYAMTQYLIALEVALGERQERTSTEHSRKTVSDDDIPF